MSIIVAENLSKSYRVADKTAGIGGTVRHFLRRRYRQIEAVCRASFALKSGEIVGFLGPNGAGKTTALKMLTGLVCPSSGEARVCGAVPFRRTHAFLRRITLVMGQKQQLMWDLPPLDSMRINAAVYDIPEPVFRQRVKELADMLQLGPQLSQPVRKLSLGERMKAELLAALLHQPDVLFLDEPTLGLDVNAQAAVREFLRAYNRRFGATVLLTSHYMADISALCERVLLIHRGKIMYDGALSRIVERFAPYREVRIELARPAADADFSGYGEVVRNAAREVRLIVRRQALTESVAALLRDWELTDLTVADPPLEEIIGRLFSRGSLE